MRLTRTIATVIGLSPLLGCSAAGTARPDVLLIAIDTLRADRLSTYGAQRPTPNIDALGASGTVFENAFSPSTWTLPSFASLFTATYPRRHQLGSSTAVLPENLPTLAEHLGRHGYHTVGLYDPGWLNPASGLGRGFDEFVAGRGFQDLEQRLVPLLEAAGDAPLLLFFHTYDVHQPYFSSPPEYGALYADPSYRSPLGLRAKRIPSAQGRATVRLSVDDVKLVSDLYDGEVRYVDDSLPDLFQTVDRHRADRTRLVVLLSDHGESFGESGRLLHSGGPHRELSHVPLILAGEGIPARRRVHAVVEALGLLPTLIDLLDLSNAGLTDVDGRSFADHLRRRPANPEGEAFAIAQSTPRRTDTRWAVRTALWALVEDLQGTHLYDRRNDPQETENIATEHSAVVAHLEAIYRARAATGPVEIPGEASVDDSTIEGLKALGYVD